MADRPKGVPFIRKLSIFFFLLTTLGAFFSFYYLQFIPTNKAELEKRGFRKLKMFTTNIISRNNDIIKIFGNQSEQSAKDDSIRSHAKKDVYGQLNILYPFSIEDDKTNHKNVLSIDKSATGDWSFYYNSQLNKLVKIAPTDIIEPSLTGASQVFNSCLLLRQEDSSQTIYDIVFDQNNTVVDGAINLDTLGRLQKNSYQSAILDINVSGTAYKMFLNPFIISDQKLILVGLMSNKHYNQLANYAPVGDTLFIIIVVLVLIVSLPFIKIFSLSPKEKIAFTDVIGTALSIFSGSSVIVIIMATLFINYGLNKENSGKLLRISEMIKNDVESEIKSAEDQLNEYDRKFNRYTNNQTLDTLAKNKGGSNPDSSVRNADSLFYPLIYKNIYRVFWVNKQGQEITKWNPFNFYAPLTDVTNHRYYKLLSNQSSQDRPFNFVLYPGVSNVTGEFQVTVARRINPDSAYKSSKGSAEYLALSAFFGISILPVLPKDFGFCIVDNKTGTVLIHSDSKRNLQENIFDETDNNGKLIESIRYKEAATIENIELYGDPHKLYLEPITGQPLSLIVFYNKSSVYNSMFRIIYFTIEVLFWIYFCIALCVVWHSVAGRKTSKLNFTLITTEWFRPSAQNSLSYFFNKSYFRNLLFLSISFTVVNIYMAWDSSTVFFLCILTAIFTVLGFVISRKTDTFLREYKNGSSISAKDATTIFFPTLLFGTIVIIIISIMWLNNWNINSLRNLGYVGCFIFAMVLILRSNYNKTYSAGNVEKYKNAEKEHNKEIKRAYHISLLEGILLVAIVPTTGILFYAFTAERIQQKKYEVLSVAVDFQNRKDYIRHDINQKYNSLYTQTPDFINYLNDTFIRRKGIYIDTMFDSVSDTVLRPQSRSVPIPDKLFGLLTENYSGFTRRNLGNYFMNDSSADSAGWRFEFFNKSGGNLVLHGKIGERDAVYASAGKLLIGGWWLNASNLVVFILFPLVVLCILGIISWVLLGEIMRRLFLVDYFPAGEDLQIDEGYLQAIFSHPHTDEHRKLYLYGSNVPSPAEGWRSAFDTERNFSDQCYPCSQEEYILANCFYFEKIFEKMWAALSKEEKYLLYDLAFDGYTNYKDAAAIYQLLHKGVLIHENLRLQFFSYSFKNYILSKKGSEEIIELNVEIATPGMWEVLRIPILTLICIIGIFLFITQNDLSHQITALVTTAAALIPLVIKLMEKPNNPAVVKTASDPMGLTVTKNII